MGYYTRVDGSIEVTPRVPWAKIKGTRFLPEYFSEEDWRTFVFDVVEDVVDTDEGVLTRKCAERIVCATDDTFKAYYAEEHLQELVDHLGPDYTFSGCFQGEGEEQGDVWRLRVRDGKVQKISASLSWPSDA